MALTIPHSFVSGTIAEASEANANFTAIKNYVDGISTGTNIDSAAISASQLQTSAVTTTKIADGSVTYIKLDTGTVPSSLAENDQIVLGSQVFG